MGVLLDAQSDLTSVSDVRHTPEKMRTPRKLARCPKQTEEIHSATVPAATDRQLLSEPTYDKAACIHDASVPVQPPLGSVHDTELSVMGNGRVFGTSHAERKMACRAARDRPERSIRLPGV